MTTDTIEKKPEQHAFQAEVSRLLHLMVHSVYSNRDIFLRELISNAADACEKLRFQAVADPALIADGAPFAITLEADAAARRLTVADNGIGMTRQELIDHLGTIARSGTRAFLDEIGDAKEGSRLIGQFGVGFYSAFMVASEVVVTSRKAGADEAWAWRSDGAGSFEVTPVPLERAPARGTRVELHLNDDGAKFAEESEIERVVQAYSAHVPVPIRFAKAGEPAAKDLTDGSALWAKPKSDVAKEEYDEFYGTVSGQWDKPALTLHYRAEGRHEYAVLLFVPSMKPFDLFDPDRKGRVKLYVRRVFITDEAELLPSWARFVRGVIDSEDLPLNISREMLQHNPILEAIRKAVTTRILNELAKTADNDAETYAKIWDAFGPVIKEGLYEDAERRDDLFKIARFRTTRSTGVDRSLAQYVAELKENQTRIYYVLADSIERAEASPHLEGYRARGIEVLLLTDPVDAFWVRTALGFDGKPFQSITQGAADLDQIPLAEDKKTEDDAGKPREAEVASLVAWLKEALAAQVGDVRVSKRLAESPACLVAPDFGPDREFEKILARAQKGGVTKPILEINPGHALIRGLTRRIADPDKAALEDAAHLLYGQARILDGELPEDAAGFARRMMRAMEKLIG